MSLAKYMQFYKNSGFFAGSKIKVTIIDESFYGSNLILSKDGNVLATTAIVGEVTDLYTDESGTLEISAENQNGDVLAGTVEITAYGTYYAYLSGTYTDRSRYVYKDKDDVTLEELSQTDTVKIAYTGDISEITATTDDETAVDVSVDKNVISVTNKNSDRQKHCTVTATIAATEDFDSANISFNVNVLTGEYGTWSDATDEVIANMIAKADAGEIDLADYWNIGETRRIHLGSIPAGEVTAQQLPQDIDLVILHNPLGQDAYTLTTPTEGRRYQPNFIIGTKDCLEYLTVMGYFAKSLTANYDSSSSNTVSGYADIDKNNQCELYTVLNSTFVDALPSYIQQCLKSVNRRYASKSETINTHASDYYSSTIMATQSQKVSLPNIVELGYQCDLHLSNASSYPRWLSSVGAYVFNNNSSMYYYTVRNPAQDINNSGVKFSYYDENSIVKHKGLTGGARDYYVSGSLMIVTDYHYINTKTAVAMCYYIDETGTIQTLDLNNNGLRTKLRGISPIMFI